MGEVSTVGLDIAKSVLQVHGVDGGGALGEGRMTSASETRCASNWYRSEDLDMEFRLCPALFRYFDEAPKHLYAQVMALD
jgi:hypothetical protein